MYDYKYSLEIMKQELNNKYISNEIKYAFRASIKAMEDGILAKKQKDHEDFHEELLKENERYILIQTINRLNKENAQLKTDLNSIWKEINNAHYLRDMKSTNFYNLIHEVAEIIKPNYEEIGKEFIE
ncbi:MAG: hypothetical protein ACREV6_19560 [Clostridium sp.]|uniref:hypothetical protein n=1 Tax=Clostridium sp. TaxID=1506 RepID=UPI003D6D0866